MNQNATIGLALLLAVVAAALTILLLSPGMEAGPGAAGGIGSADAGALRALGDHLGQLETRVAALESVRPAERDPIHVSPAAGVLDEQALERAVLRVLERRADQQANTIANDGAAAAAALLRELSALPAGDARGPVWQRIRDGGHVDAAVAEFERRAATSPFDSLVHTELAPAYFAKMMTTGGGPEAGRWGSKAAQALEKAIELDPRNHDARYSLALHYYADMRGDSVKHLETLVAEQQGRRLEPKEVRTYLLLGNIHFDAGRKDAARRVWEAGLVSFPGNATLLERLQALQ